MLKEGAYIPEERLLSGEGSFSCIKIHQAPGGQLLLCSRCSSSLVAQLRADEGLHAFARRPDREHQLLLSIAQRSENRLTLAYTTTGIIIGQATIAPGDSWWQGIGNTYEIAVEVSTGWRKQGIARQLLARALAFEQIEEYLILGLGLSWHWDYEGMGMSRFSYREMLARFFAAYGFAEYLTSEPNIRMDPANILMAHLGNRLNKENINRFFQQLLCSDVLPGL